MLRRTFQILFLVCLAVGAFVVGRSLLRAALFSLGMVFRLSAGMVMLVLVGVAIYFFLRASVQPPEAPPDPSEPTDWDA